VHHYRGYWSDGGKCRIRIYREDGNVLVVVCSQLPDNENTSVSNIAEYLAAEVIKEHDLHTPLVWIEHYPEHEGDIGEYSLVRFSSWELQEVCLVLQCHLYETTHGRLRAARLSRSQSITKMIKLRCKVSNTEADEPSSAKWRFRTRGCMALSGGITPMVTA
jgi:hypothetical protein